MDFVMLMLLLFFTGLVAGTIDAIAGGGGLISVPVLLGVGLPPHMAFGTNKFQGAVGTLFAARRYCRAGWVSAKDIYLGLFSGILGAIAGAVVNQLVSSDVLRVIAPIMLAIIFIYTLLSPRLGQRDQSPRISSALFYMTFGFALAFYDGFFGPGVGAFWVFLMMFFLGFNLIKATAYTKVFNLNSSIVALICFAIGSNIDYKVGLCMAAGQVLGGQLGAMLALYKGVKLIRPLFLTMMFATITSLAYRNYGDSVLRAIAFEQHKSAYLPAFIVLFIAVFYIFRRIHQNQQQTQT
jgi:uncharacterized membrane protein YfcA